MKTNRALRVLFFVVGSLLAIAAWKNDASAIYYIAAIAFILLGIFGTKRDRQ